MVHYRGVTGCNLKINFQIKLYLELPLMVVFVLVNNVDPDNLGFTVCQSKHLEVTSIQKFISYIFRTREDLVALIHTSNRTLRTTP